MKLFNAPCERVKKNSLFNFITTFLPKLFLWCNGFLSFFARFFQLLLCTIKNIYANINYAFKTLQQYKTSLPTTIWEKAIHKKNERRDTVLPTTHPHCKKGIKVLKIYNKVPYIYIGMCGGRGIYRIIKTFSVLWIVRTWTYWCKAWFFKHIMWKGYIPVSVSMYSVSYFILLLVTLLCEWDMEN